ncbi:hypothetical protein SDC9_179966 [bioreactor metagenome]|uniref:Uncharacterized protein n=1 Tax=bioreactor metagenome TaxID=1076179 RepID=A0A645H0B7_9ZZZZ
MPIFAVAVLIEDAFDRLGDEVDFVGNDEVVQQVADLGFRAHASGDVDLKTFYPVLHAGNEAKIVESCACCVLSRIGKRNFIFAR